MYPFTWNHPNCVKRSWETGHLRGVGNFAWGNVFAGAGGKIRWRIVLTIWFLMGKIIEFFGYCGEPQFFSRENPDIRIEISKLLFIIKHYESILGIIKIIWLYLKIYYWAQASEKCFCEQFSENLSIMV